MANTSPTVDNTDTLKIILHVLPKKISVSSRLLQSPRSLKGRDEVDMLALKEAGACGFTDDGIPLLNAEFCYQAMKNAAKLNVPISLHEEDPAFIRNNGINHGKDIRCTRHLRFSIHCRRSTGGKRLSSGAPFRCRCCNPAYQFRCID